MKKILVISIISSSLLLWGCFKEDVKKEVIENTPTGVIQTWNLEINEINKTNSWIISNNTWSKNITVDIEENKPDIKSKEKKLFILNENKLTTLDIKDIKNDYKNIAFIDKVIYYKNLKELKNFSINWCYDWEEWKYNDCFSYNDWDWTVIEIKNILKRDWNWFWSRKWDIYESWKLLIKDFPFWCWDWCEWPIYNKKSWVISVKEWRGDVCAWFNTNRQYDIKTKKFSSYTDNFNWCFVESRSISFWKWENNIIDMYDYKKEKSSSNIYSIFSISKWVFKRNYIYDSNLKIETKENFMNIWNNVTYFLEWKEFKINFDELEKSKEKMSILYWGWWENTNFDYWIYLKKQWNNYTIHFDKIKSEIMSSEKVVKDIWIISCKSNISKEYDNEYILKTKDKSWNYKYNISEKLNNKCGIPYKINVYYTDWTKETWEYYILFDY